MNLIASKTKELHLVLNQVDIKQTKTEEDNFIVIVLFVEKRKLGMLQVVHQGKKSLKGDGIMTDVGGIAADALYHHGIPWLAKKTVEMGRYGASELLRNPSLQKKAVNYGMKKLTPFVVDTAGKAMDQLSTKIRPNQKYKTDRKDLDGRGVDIHK